MTSSLPPNLGMEATEQKTRQGGGGDGADPRTSTHARRSIALAPGLLDGRTGERRSPHHPVEPEGARTRSARRRGCRRRQDGVLPDQGGRRGPGGGELGRGERRAG